MAELVRSLLGKQHERETVAPVRIRLPPPDFGCLAQLVEQGVDNAQVIGSIPMASTSYDSLAQLAERWSPKPQVGGSMPSRVAKKGRLPEWLIGAHSKCDGCESSTKVRILHLPPVSRCSSVGRAPCYERGGHGFKSCQRGQKVWRCGREV